MELLPTIWFVAIAVLWTGYLFLEGFDLGVGMLMKLFARHNTDRRVLLNTIGPVWDGNEVWLLTAAGATFAASLSGTPRCSPASTSRYWQSWPLDLPGSRFRIQGGQGGLRAVAQPLGLGDRDRVLRGRVRHRRSLGAHHHGPALECQWGGPRRWPNVLVQRLRTPWRFRCGGVCLVHALAFLALKTDGDVRHRARRWFIRLVPFAVLPMFGWMVAVQFLSGKPWTWALVAAAIVAVVLAWRLARAGSEGRAFSALGAFIVCATARSSELPSRWSSPPRSIPPST